MKPAEPMPCQQDNQDQAEDEQQPVGHAAMSRAPPQQGQHERGEQKRSARDQYGRGPERGRRQSKPQHILDNSGDGREVDDAEPVHHHAIDLRERDLQPFDAAAGGEVLAMMADMSQRGRLAILALKRQVVA